VRCGAVECNTWREDLCWVCDGAGDGAGTGDCAATAEPEHVVSVTLDEL
jgi:hypothetical protein